MDDKPDFSFIRYVNPYVIQNSNPADGATCNGWGWEPDG